MIIFGILYALLILAFLCVGCYYAYQDGKPISKK